MILKLSDLSMQFGEKVLFSNVNAMVKKGSKIALVGANGSGKTTLLKIVSGELEATSGKVEFFGTKIGIVKQFRIEKDRTLYEEGLSVFKKAVEAYDAAVKSAEKSDLESYEYHLRLAESLDVYTAEKKVKKMLIGVGFEEKDFNRMLSTLSAGEITRLQLAKLLIEEPDLLVLDEPGNYLDVYSMVFLKRMLSSLKSAVLMATHDREIMNDTVDYVWDLDFQTVRTYKGGYVDFLKQKSEYIKSVKAREHQLSKEISRLEKVIDRYKKWGREKAARQAKSKEKELVELVRKREELSLKAKRKVNLRFSSTRTFEDVVLKAKDLEVSAGEKYIGKFSFKIRNGDRVALIGRNGVGKTSLLKTVVRSEKGVEFGPNVKLAYVDTVGSNRSEKTLISLLWQIVPRWEDYEVRKYLGRFGFIGEDVFKSENVLSGGEFVRFQIAKALLKEPNFLIMDEPTNHLDIYMIESLEENLKNYEGTLFFSTHDLKFAKNVANVFFVMSNGSLDFFNDYERMLEFITNETATEEGEREKKDEANTYEYRKSLKNKAKSLKVKMMECEKDFESLDERLKEIEKEMVLNSRDHLKLEELVKEKEEIETKMESLLERIENFEEERKRLEEEVKW